LTERESNVILCMFLVKNIFMSTSQESLLLPTIPRSCIERLERGECLSPELLDEMKNGRVRVYASLEDIRNYDPRHSMSLFSGLELYTQTNACDVFTPLGNKKINILVNHALTLDESDELFRSIVLVLLKNEKAHLNDLIASENRQIRIALSSEEEYEAMLFRRKKRLKEIEGILSEIDKNLENTSFK